MWKLDDRVSANLQQDSYKKTARRPLRSTVVPNGDIEDLLGIH